MSFGQFIIECPACGARTALPVIEGQKPTLTHVVCSKCQRWIPVDLEHCKTESVQ